MSFSKSGPLDLNKKQLSKAFDRVASSYDLATHMSQGYQQDLDRSARTLDLKGNEDLLDLCCGTGKSTLACFKQLPSGKITGVDNSPGMLDVARRKFSSEVEQGRMEFLLRDAMDPGFKAESFDAAFTAYGLRNMPDPEKFVCEVFRVLKPGGQICIHDFSLVNKGWAKWYWSILGYGFIVPFCTLMSGSSSIYLYLIKSVNAFFSPEEISELLLENGFVDIRIHRHASWRKPILHTVTAFKP